ncbi:MAG: phosphoenolpyruvate--protein phosphotransferase [Alphaproteobacteria bacterium]|nr:phosphoenolpyruvate--protein phosphotransferase [Alphaproteobacteria bacterium]
MIEKTGQNITRLVLRHIRDVMVKDYSPVQRLQQIIDIIAAHMNADVCSIYILRAGEVLELFATHGLKKEAVSKTRLRVGEGLVGEIAAYTKPLALRDAQHHPSFVFRPETGEEIYNSFMGVPIIRSAKILGVLVTQDRQQKQYTEEEIETLEIIATVLAELIINGELIDPLERYGVEGTAMLPQKLEGIALNQGLTFGYAVLYEPEIVLKQMINDDPVKETQRLYDAVAKTQTSLDKLLESQDVIMHLESRDILETYKLIIADQGWISRIKEAIETGLTAEAAIQKIKNDTRLKMQHIKDPYLKERLTDLDDLANRLIYQLTGQNYRNTIGLKKNQDIILIARNMSAVELVNYDPGHLKGLILEEGSIHSHVTIVAKAFNIPVLVHVAGIMDRVTHGETIILDADSNQVYIRPSEDIKEIVSRNIEYKVNKQQNYLALKNLPAISQDKIPISLNINAGLLMDLTSLEASGAEGIGLYRTEVPFMIYGTFPDLSTQIDLYKTVYNQVKGKPVFFRTLDLGGDKLLPYWNSKQEPNPALGWRAIRISLDRPAMLRQQLRALLESSANEELRIMFPLVAEVSEFKAARTILNLEIEKVKKSGKKLPRFVRVGVMLEVPSLVWQLPTLLHFIDFLSIGTNDLHQYLFATDRDNSKVSDRYDVLSPSMLSMLYYIVQECKKAKIPVSVCGEMASNPLEAMVLIGLGFQSLSMTALAIGAVKTMIRSLNIGALSLFLDDIIHLSDHSLRSRLKNYAYDRSIEI